MPLAKSLHHVGIAVHSIDEQRQYYEDVLGAKFEGTEVIAEQGVRVAFYRLHNVLLELLEPTDSTGPIARFLHKRDQGLHHLAFLVDDIQGRIEQLKAEGFNLIDTQPRTGAHQMQVAFLDPKSTHGVLTELCEAASARDQPT